jgi:general stress protein 26
VNQTVQGETNSTLPVYIGGKSLNRFIHVKAKIEIQKNEHPALSGWGTHFYFFSSLNTLMVAATPARKPIVRVSTRF